MRELLGQLERNLKATNCQADVLRSRRSSQKDEEQCGDERYQSANEQRVGIRRITRTNIVAELISRQGLLERAKQGWE